MGRDIVKQKQIWHRSYFDIAVILKFGVTCYYWELFFLLLPTSKKIGLGLCTCNTSLAAGEPPEPLMLGT